MRISGTDDSGWMPIDLAAVAQAITVLQRLATDRGDAGAARSSLTQVDPPVTEPLTRT